MIMSLVSFVMMNIPSHAALPPYYDRVVQLTTILESKEVANVMGPATLINSIQKAEGNELVYGLTTAGPGSCSLTVELEVVPPQKAEDGTVMVGPTKYKVSKLHGMTCLPVGKLK